MTSSTPLPEYKSIRGYEKEEMMKIIETLKALHVHRYTWTEETKHWFYTGEKKGFIGSVCTKCGKKSERL